jgi:hypothetical protein
MTRIFTDDSEVKDQPSMVAILVFRGNITMLLPFGTRYSQDKSTHRRTSQKNVKEKIRHQDLPVLENFWPTKHTNDTKSDIRCRRIGDFIHGKATLFFNFESFRCLPAAAGVSWGPNALASPSASCESREKPIQLL